MNMINDLDFENMGIYDLRNYARNIGVLSPTKLKRDELIEKITAIINGETPEQKKTNKGRPPKHKQTDESRLDFLLPKNIFSNDNIMYKNYENTGHKFSGFNNVLCENTKFATSNILCDGYFYPVDENYGFILKKGYLSNYYKENSIILSDLSQKYNLKLGDYVVGACKYVESKNVMLVTDISKINGSAHFDGTRCDITQTKAHYPNQKIALSANNSLIDFDIIDKICPIAKGSRVVINFENKENEKEYIIKFLNSISISNGIKTILFTIDELPEEVCHIIDNCSEIEVVQNYFGMTREQYLEMAKMKIANCCRLLEMGEDVAIVCYSSEQIKKSIEGDALINKQLTEIGAKNYAISKIKEMFCLARSIDKGSLTTILLDEKSEEINNVSSVSIYVNQNTYDQTDIKVDLFKSKTKNVENIISKNEQEKLSEFRKNLTQNNVLNCLNKLFE